MGELEYLAIGYVFFMFLIVAEAGVSVWRGNGRYRLSEAVGNIGHGAVYQVFDYFTKALVMVPYLLVAEHYAIAELPVDAWWAWIVAILAFDFVNYWQHRHGHEVNWMWAVHGVHHAAEDYNFAAALRQPLLSHLYSWAYRLPLALFIPLPMFVGVVVFDFLYQFVQHTRYVPKLGPVEWLMNTPSHHRVHHGRNEQYLDKNYGGIFIIWDRLFGTFEAEGVEPDYGITNPIGTVDPAWGNLVLWWRLVEASRRARGWRNKVAVWWVGPGETSRVAPEVETAALASSPEPVVAGTKRATVYVLVQSLVALPLLPLLIYVGADWPAVQQLALAVFMVGTASALVAVLEGRPWATRAEVARVLVLTAGVTLAVPALL